MPVFAEVNGHFFPQTPNLFQRVQYNKHTYPIQLFPLSAYYLSKSIVWFYYFGCYSKAFDEPLNASCSLCGFLQIVIWKYFFNIQEFKCHMLLLCLQWHHLTYKPSRRQKQKCQDRDVLSLSKKHTWKCEWTARNAGMAMNSKEKEKEEETFLKTWITKPVFKPPWWIGSITCSAS